MRPRSFLTIARKHELKPPTGLVEPGAISRTSFDLTRYDEHPVFSQINLPPQSLLGRWTSVPASTRIAQATLRGSVEALDRRGGYLTCIRGSFSSYDIPALIFPAAFTGIESAPPPSLSDGPSYIFLPASESRDGVNPELLSSRGFEFSIRA